jgi:hypothetical protein
VDRYCTDQGNANDKHDKIKSMDTIYESVFATIIATSVIGSTNGLPVLGAFLEQFNKTLLSTD